jgi:hypothetical protein
MQRIEQTLVHRFGVSERDHVFVHLSKLLGKVGLLCAFQLFEPAEDCLFKRGHSPVQRAKFLQDLGELFAVISLGSGVARYGLLRFCAQLLHRRREFVGDLDFHRHLHWSGLLGKILTDGLDQSRDIMPARFNRDLQAALARSLGGHWSDAGDLHVHRPRQTERQEIFNCG